MTVMSLRSGASLGVEFDETEMAAFAVYVQEPLVVVRDTGEVVDSLDGHWFLTPYGVKEPSSEEDQTFLFRVHMPGQPEPLYHIDLWVTWAGFGDDVSWANGEWTVEVRFAGTLTAMRLPLFTWEPPGAQHSEEDAERVRLAMSVLDPDPEVAGRYEREEVL